jgi:hypothetical protein
VWGAEGEEFAQAGACADAQLDAASASTGLKAQGGELAELVGGPFERHKEPASLLPDQGRRVEIENDPACAVWGGAAQTEEGRRR